MTPEEQEAIYSEATAAQRNYNFYKQNLDYYEGAVSHAREQFKKAEDRLNKAELAKNSVKGE